MEDGRPRPCGRANLGRVSRTYFPNVLSERFFIQHVQHSGYGAFSSTQDRGTLHCRMRFSAYFRDWQVKVAIAIAVAVAFAIERAWWHYRQRRSESWPIAQALIRKAAVHDSKHESILTLWYSYPAPGEQYSISAEFQKTFYSHEEACLWGDALSGKTVPVRLDPRNPWKSFMLDIDLQPIVASTRPANLTPDGLHAI